MADQHIDTATFAGSGFVTFLHVRASGRLHGLAVAGGIGYHFFRVTLDQRLLVENYLSGIYGGPAHGNNGIAIGLAFESELKVEIRNSVSSPQTVFWASYVITGMPRPSGAEYEEEEIEGVHYVYEQTENRTVLAGPTRWSRVQLEYDTWLPSEEIQGAVVLSGIREANMFESEVPLILRVPGRTRSLGVAARLENVQGFSPFRIRPEMIFELAGEQLPFLLSVGRGLELVADLPGYANFPSQIL